MYIKISLFWRFKELSDDGKVLYCRCLSTCPEFIGIISLPANLIRLKLMWPIPRFDAAVKSCVDCNMMVLIGNTFVLKDWYPNLRKGPNDDRKIFRCIGEVKDEKIKAFLVEELGKTVNPDVLAEGVRANTPKVEQIEELPGVDEFTEAWKNSGFPLFLRFNDKRRSAFRARCRDPFFVNNWKVALERMSKSRFCNGENDHSWVANVDFFLRPGTVTNIMEGKYDQRGVDPLSGWNKKYGKK